LSQTPPLQDGEEVLFDHIPSLRVFKRTALLLLGLTVPAVIVFLVVLPDTFWPAVPLFVTCLLLMQERFRLGRYRAWITNQRVILQGDRSIALSDIQAVAVLGNGVRIAWPNGGKGTKLMYSADKPALAQAIEAARREAA
jgi:hypothetical protein